MALFTGKNLIQLPVIPSTNTFALDLLSAQPVEGTVVWALDQPQGRGQKGNTWISQSGTNLTFSVIYFPKFLKVDNLFALSKLTALAVLKTLKRCLPMQDVQIKWPNDLLINGQKVGGILIENQLERAMVKSAVIGIGLNVNQAEFPEELSSKATSMVAWADQPFDLFKVLEILWDELEAQYLQLKAGKVDHLNREYLAHLFGYQETVWVKIGDQTTQAMMVGVDKSGRVALEQGGKLNYYDIKEASILPEPWL
ncbi:biotin--[acetyl-CoA-carboxylase] ligase [Pontibacter sp. G13]|uniref:biotin--[acetyl-CoA-carboxylase] ligase n=1 Tax=Pontibacter sp. G13 TaxID=3074898 RepID=UPI00288A1D3C|nr:biotin--[acetyl-CoA-carboxylase] ligase [Pontibacter sp. G13]WNJ16157.1 biotin--[acetyl-CoA-carboxylase] ligase [Pontibacter sp. G13]